MMHKNGRNSDVNPAHHLGEEPFINSSIIKNQFFYDAFFFLDEIITARNNTTP